MKTNIEQISDIIDLLVRLEDYMDGRSDVDNDVPNAEILFRDELNKSINMMEHIESRLIQTTALLLESTKNLGHPAYGLSSSNTLAIDELREKCFDFLGVPKNQLN